MRKNRNESFLKNHEDLVKITFVEMINRYGASVMYAIIPILVMSMTNEIVAGIFMSVCNLVQGFILSPILGNLEDRQGAKPWMIVSSFNLIFAGIFLIAFNPSFLILIFFSIFLFGYYASRATDVYLLRVSNKKEGGFVFGFSENFFSIAYFFASISIPFFVLKINHDLLGYVVLSSGILSLLVYLGIKKDIVKKTKKITFLELLNPILTLKSGYRFVKSNKFYPIMVLTAGIWQGFFYGSLWFVIPIHISKLGISGLMAGLQLGIYEVVTVFIAAYSGYLADKFNWRYLHSSGWFLVLAGAILMPFFPIPLGLVLVGLIIGIGNNLFFFSARHALEYYDIDHEEDGRFLSLNVMMETIGYSISPILTSIFYSYFGFVSTLILISIISGILAIIMIGFTIKCEKRYIKKTKRRK